MTYVSAVLIMLGSLLALLAAVGVFRMPDIYSRMQTATKAGTLGIFLLLSGVAVHFREFSVTTTTILIVAFLGLTAPIAAHVIGRAAYLAGEPLWKGTVLDELARDLQASEERRSSDASEADTRGK